MQLINHNRTQSDFVPKMKSPEPKPQGSQDARRSKINRLLKQDSKNLQITHMAFKEKEIRFKTEKKVKKATFLIDNCHENSEFDESSVIIEGLSLKEKHERDRLEASLAMKRKIQKIAFHCNRELIDNSKCKKMIEDLGQEHKIKDLGFKEVYNILDDLKGNDQSILESSFFYRIESGNQLNCEAVDLIKAYKLG